jgi:hypothetical protein
MFYASSLESRVSITGCEAHRVGSWASVLRQATIEDASIVHFAKSQFER